MRECGCCAPDPTVLLTRWIAVGQPLEEPILPHFDPSNFARRLSAACKILGIDHRPQGSPRYLRLASPHSRRPSRLDLSAAGPRRRALPGEARDPAREDRRGSRGGRTEVERQSKVAEASVQETQAEVERARL